MTSAPVHVTRAQSGSFWWEYQIVVALEARDVARLIYLVRLAEAQERAA